MPNIRFLGTFCTYPLHKSAVSWLYKYLVSHPNVKAKDLTLAYDNMCHLDGMRVSSLFYESTSIKGPSIYVNISLFLYSFISYFQKNNRKFCTNTFIYITNRSTFQVYNVFRMCSHPKKSVHFSSLFHYILELNRSLTM